MARIFISHSSKNNAEAIVLRDWLVSEGWDDFFLDLDTNSGILAGERWERALNEAAMRCEAVLFLVSKAWLASDWCLKEFHLATKLNKRLFGIQIDDIPIEKLPAELSATWQLVNLATGNDHKIFRATLPGAKQESHISLSKSGLQRLKAGLSKAGLDARFFAWPPESQPNRSPYRGMRPLEAEDAGIFFGREAPIIGVLDQLRGLKDNIPLKLLSILGASGAGKSSFLRAGLIPRLMRDDRNYLVLPIIRPERAALSGETGLLASLETAGKKLSLKQNRASIRSMLTDDGNGLLQALAKKATPAPLKGETPAETPAIVLAVDQAEELFSAEGSTEAQQFLAFLAKQAANRSVNLIIIFTIRSDAYEKLQSAAELEGLAQHTFSLPPLPKGSYQTVIEGPAMRLRNSDNPLNIEPALVQQLLRDIESGGAKDALPLLAFTLERIFLDYGGGGTLQLSNYLEIGGIKGSIEAAVERALSAADKDPTIPKDRVTRLALIRRALIPWLAGIDPETKSPRRKVARLSEIPEEARPLVQHLVEQRLLSTDVIWGSEEKTIEPAHESLLRQWGLLQGWLDEDFGALTTIESLRRSSRDWAANAKANDWLTHSAGRLEDAEKLVNRPDLRCYVDKADLAYLTACRTVETLRRDKELQQARKLGRAYKIGGIVAASLAALASLAANYGFNRANFAETALARAQKSQTQYLSTLAAQEYRRGDAVTARLLGLEAIPESSSNKLELESILNRSLKSSIKPDSELKVLSVNHRPITSLTVARDRDLFAFSLDRGEVAIGQLSKKGEPLNIHKICDTPISQIELSADGKKLLVLTIHSDLLIFDVESKNIGLPIKPPRGVKILKAHFTPIDRKLLVAMSNGVAAILEPEFGKTYKIFDMGILKRPGDNSLKSPPVTEVKMSPDGNLVVTASQEGKVSFWDVDQVQLLKTIVAHDDVITNLAFSDTGEKLVSSSWDGYSKIYQLPQGVQFGSPNNQSGTIWRAEFLPKSDRILTSSSDRTMQKWGINGNVNDYERSGAPFYGHEGEVLSAFPYEVKLPGNKSVFEIVSLSTDRTIRFWKWDDKADFNDDSRTVSRCLSPTLRRRFALEPEPPNWCVEKQKWPYQSEQWQTWFLQKMTGHLTPLPQE